MGGFGSGRPGGKQKAEDVRSLDVNRRAVRVLSPPAIVAAGSGPKTAIRSPASTWRPAAKACTSATASASQAATGRAWPTPCP